MNDKALDLPFDEWMSWFEEVMHPSSWKQLAVIIGMGLLAWLVVYMLRQSWQRKHSDSPYGSTTSVMLGARGYDGLVFPGLWLVLTYVASLFMQVAVRRSLFRIAIPVIFALLVIRAVVKILRLTFKGKAWVGVLESTFSWVIWGAVVLWATGLAPVLLGQLESIKIQVGSIDTNVLSLLIGSVTVVAALLAALWLSSLVQARLLRNATGSSLSLRMIMSNLVRGLLLLIALVVGLKAVNIDLTAFSVFGGALGVGIGLGLQKLASNYVSGFVVLAERSIRIGDQIKIDGFEGHVVNIAARYTVVRAIVGTEAIFPNDMLVNQRVENKSLADPRVWQFIPVTVGYDSDVALVQKLLVEAALAQERVCRDPMPAASLDNLGDNGLEFKLGFWISDPEKSLLPLRSAINIMVLNSLKAHNIDIPYPQREIRLLNELPFAASDDATASAAGKNVKPADGVAPAANQPANPPHLPAP